jgi:hypothetical protein
VYAIPTKNSIEVGIMREALDMYRAKFDCSNEIAQRNAETTPINLLEK